MAAQLSSATVVADADTAGWWLWSYDFKSASINLSLHAWWPGHQRQAFRHEPRGGRRGMLTL